MTDNKKKCKYCKEEHPVGKADLGQQFYYCSKKKKFVTWGGITVNL